MSESDNKSRMQIGKKLHDARVAKGYTLDDLQQATKIQKRYLIAIEDEKFNELPGDFYVRAFVKQYADMVGLDGSELLKDYSDELPETKTHEYSEHISQAVETRSSHHQREERVDKFRQYLPTIIIVIIIVVVLLAIWLTSIARSRRDASTRIDSSSVSVSGKSKESSSHKKVKKVVHRAASTAVKLNESARTNNSVTYAGKSLKQSTNLAISTKGSSSYVTVNVDGSSRVARTMQANSSDTVKLAKNVSQITITVNNPTATTIRIGGKKVDFTRGGKNNGTRRIVINLGRSRSASSSSASSNSTTNRNSTTNNTRTSTTGTRTTTTGGTNNTTNGTQTTRTTNGGNTGNNNATTTTTTTNGGGNGGATR